MPRVEIEGSHRDMDLCRRCWDDCRADGTLVKGGCAVALDFDLDGLGIGSINVEHPPYDDDDYECHQCGANLGVAD